jgi:hypothetical protein
MDSNDSSSDDDDIPYRFIVDKTVFHDAFRTSYEHSEDPRWLTDYFLARLSIKPNKILTIPSTIIDRLSDEFKTYPDTPSQVILIIKSIASIYPFPKNEDLNHAPIYLAKTLADFGFIPVIVSSVKKEKWYDRGHKVGMIENIEEFTKSMSQKRLERGVWFYPVSATECKVILQQVDTEYNKVLSLLR